jgi:hypothetical protein
MVPVYVSGGNVAEYELMSIVSASVREFEPTRKNCLATCVAVGTPQLVLPVTIEVPLTRTVDVGIVTAFPPVPDRGALMYTQTCTLNAKPVFQLVRTFNVWDNVGSRFKA